MAVTADSFRESYPEFTNLGDDVIEAKITDGELRCPSSVWGDFADTGVCLYVAQRLALSPWGRDLKLTNDDGSTVYDRELERLVRVVASGGRVI